MFKIALILVFTVSHCLAQNVGNPFLNNRDCEAVDLVFVLDCSWSLRSPANFEKELNFVSDVVSVLDFSRSRVSVVTFSDDAKISIYFDQYNSLPEFQSAVKALPWVGGNTYTDQALEMMVGEVRTNQRNRANSGVTTMGVVITDGGSTDPYKTEDVVRQIHTDGIEMFSIGVGTDINQKELEMIATDPDREHMFLLDDLNSLSTIKDMLASRFCRGSTPPCLSHPTNMIIVVDSASSEQSQILFNNILQLTSHLVRQINNIIRTARVFMVKFNDSYKLTKFNDASSFISALQLDPWKRKQTATDTALELILKEMDTSQNMQGPSIVAQNMQGPSIVAIVHAEDIRYLPPQTVDLLERNRVNGIPITAIGVGENILSSDLQRIASSPSDTFLVRRYKDTVSVISTVSTNLCKDLEALRGNNIETVVSECGDMDIYLVLDSSTSIGFEEFNNVLRFASNLVDLINLKFGSSVVTVIRYSDNTKMKKFTDRDVFVSEISNGEWIGGNTRTDLALEMMLTEILRIRRSNPARSKKPVGIILTDGSSTKPDRTEKIIEKIHVEQIEMFSIGIGKDRNEVELDMITSSPGNMFMMEDFVGGSQIREKLVQKICQGAAVNKTTIKPTLRPSPNKKGCNNGTFDLVFVLDSSWSLGYEENFQKELRFVTELFDYLKFDFKRSRMSVITYSDEVEEAVFQDRFDFHSILLNLPWMGGNTYTDRALDKVWEELERRRNSVVTERDRPFITVLITDGESTNPHRLKKNVYKLKNAGIRMFAIGVGMKINKEELSMIASSPIDDHMYMVDDLGVNNKLLKSFLSFGICKDADDSSDRPPTPIKCPPAEIDVVFALDSSSSLAVTGDPDLNFVKELAFVIDVIKLSNLNFFKSKLSVITYSDNYTLHQYENEEDLTANLVNLPYLGGNTYTDIAMELMLDELIYLGSVSKGTKPLIGIIITDGSSTRPSRTIEMAKKMHSYGVRLIAVGPTQPPPANICRGKPVDLNFVLDSSWSLMSEENFQKELKFVTEVVNSLSVNLGTSRFSVITFSDNAVNQIPYAMFRDRRQFQASVLKLPWIGGNTYTDKALEIMLNQVTSNAREDHLVVGVVVTDGGSTNPYRTENVVRKIHNLGITMFAIGVGMSINNKELEMIASKPTKDHLFMVDDLNGLNMLQSLLATRICPDRTRPLPPSPICQSSPADVFFIIDKSSSLMNQENFNKELAFVARVIDSIVVGTGPRDSRVGVISFSTDARLEFGLNAFTSNKEVEDALLYVEFSTGNTYTHKAINIMLEQFRATARPNVRKIGVIVTDGQSTDPFNLRKSVDEMKRENIDIFAIGAGNFKIDELNLMASDPKTKHVFKVDELDDLSEIQVELNLKTCKGNQP